jgi:hypothetical protein
MAGHTGEEFSGIFSLSQKKFGSGREFFLAGKTPSTTSLLAG